MKSLIISSLLVVYLSAGVQNVRVGEIDKHYNKIINKTELENIIKDVEYELESQVGYNLFDMDTNGVEISLLYMNPTSSEKALQRKIKKYEDKSKEIKALEEYLVKEKEKFEVMNTNYKQSSQNLNDKINIYNHYIKQVNQNTNLSYSDIQKIKQKVKTEEVFIKKEQEKNKRLFQNLKSSEREYNRKVNKYNRLNSDIQRLAKEIEALSRSIKVVKGNTFFNKEILTRTYTQDNKIVKVDREEKENNKIEIYSFESIQELKAIIAHEILHLVGVPHIEVEGALMNPYIQKNQIENLQLTREDIENIKKHF